MGFSPREEWLMKRTLCCILIAVILFGHGIPVSAEPSDSDPFGADFMDGVFFFGESTTVHLRSRSKLSPRQVWADSSGTARLDSNLAYKPLKDAKTGQDVTPVELARRDQPSCLVLSFGLNGIMEFSEHPEPYLKKYQKLIDLLREASPNTLFLIQSIYPVAQEDLQSDWRFSVSPKEINAKIQRLNRVLSEYCRDLSNVDFIDTSCKLKDENGFLRRELTTDGIHLNESAYSMILQSIEDRLRTEYEA